MLATLPSGCWAAGTSRLCLLGQVQPVFRACLLPSALHSWPHLQSPKFCRAEVMFPQRYTAQEFSLLSPGLSRPEPSALREPAIKS